MDKKNNKNRKFVSRSRVCLTDYPGNFKNLAKMKETKIKNHNKKRTYVMH